MNLHFPCQKFAQLAMSLHFPLPKIRTFRFSLHTSRLSLHGEVTWRWNSQWVHTFHSQKLFRIWIYTSLAKNSHNWQWDYTFPCQKFALFVSPFTLPVSPLHGEVTWRWNSQWVHTFHSQKLFRPLCSPSFKWHEPRDEWSKTQDKWSNPGQSYFVLPIEKLNQINTKNYWK